MFGAAAGDYTLRADADSLPAGYELAQSGAQDIRIALDAPAHAEVAVRAQRSISGRVTPARSGTEVRLRTANRTVRTDEQGRFLFRSVAPGPETLEATIAGRVTTRVLDVPEEPASLRDVDLGGAGTAGSPPNVPRSAIAPAPPAPAGASPARPAFLYYVQYSAHRDRAEAATEAGRLGLELGRPTRVVAADLGRQGRYFRVLVGAFPSSLAAQRFRLDAAARGTRLGPVHRIAVESAKQISER